MRHTINLSMLEPEAQLRLAKEADALGFDAVSLGDSILYPRESDARYPYSGTGDRSFLEGAPFLDPFVALSAIAAVTERIRLQTSVLKVPVRHPVLVAKAAGSLDALSGGRFVLGVGLSPWPEDFAALGVPHEARGRRLDEAIAIIRGLLHGGYHRHDGEFYELPEMRMDPAPETTVPLIVGGHSARALRRAAVLGDGWIGASPELDELERIIAELHREREGAGLPWEGFSVQAGTRPARTRADVARLIDLGVTDVAHRPSAVAGADTELMLADLRRLAHDLLD